MIVKGTKQLGSFKKRNKFVHKRLSTFPTQDLLAFWKLSDLTDSSGNNYTLTNDGNVQFVAGKVGNCAQFNGSNVLYSTLAPSLSFVSLSLWAKSNSGTIPFNVGNREDVSVNGTFRLITVGGTTLVWQINFGGDQNCIATFSNDDTWQHIVGTYDGSIMRLYVNAIEVQTLVIANVIFATNRPFIMGGQWVSYPSFAANSIGNVDSIGVWNRALTQQEINTLYNNGNGLEPL